VSISSISSVTSSYQPTLNNWLNNLSQIRQGFKDLASALQAGNLTDAQNAFTALQQLLPNSSAGNQTQNGQQGSGQNPFATDFNALSQALQSGDLAKARDAFAKLQQDIQSVQGHHHRHHHHKASASTQSTASTTSSSSVGSTAGSGQNQFATDFSALGQALQSGNLSQAQAAFAKLQQDMGAVAGNFNVSV
jgi:ribosomal protein S20